MGIVEKWEAFRKREADKKRKEFEKYAINEANRRFNLVNIGYNVITFDGVVVSISIDDNDSKALCERLTELREEFISKLIEESGLWK